MPEQLPKSPNDEYCCRINLNLYDSPKCEQLATQAASGRHLQVLSQIPIDSAFEVQLCEDGYRGWLRCEDRAKLEAAATRYQAVTISRQEIETRLPEVITFTQAVMHHPNIYLWGGTVGPNYDCSGLMQAAFAASGIWLPRDSYQQAAFTRTIEQELLLPGDLVFFGTPEKVNHVGLYLGDRYYIHSSGQEKGRNGIAIDCLTLEGDEIGQAYYRQFKQGGRVEASYHPQI